MSEDLIKCTKICVNCVPNDPVDIRCGGPNYLGFYFFVREEETEQMKKFIIVSLKELEVPLENIYDNGIVNLPKEKVWDKKRILTCIQGDAEYLISEAGYTSRGFYRR